MKLEFGPLMQESINITQQKEHYLEQNRTDEPEAPEMQSKYHSHPCIRKARSSHYTTEIV